MEEKSISQRLQKVIAGAVVDSGAELGRQEIKLEHPELSEHGDYSTNVALAMNGGRLLAEKIAGTVKPDEVIAKVEVAGPGFVNIWLQKEYLVKELGRVITQGQDYGKGLAISGKKVMIEFTDPNPFKEFHIGHVYTNTVGEALAKIIEYQGADVWRVNYQGDVGLHVAKSVWGMEKLSDEMPKESASLGEKAKFMGRAYAAGAKTYEEDEQKKMEIEKLNKQIYEKDAAVMKLYALGKKWSLDYFEAMYARLGTSFRRYYFESEAGERGLKLVRDNMGHVFAESDGAVVFPGESYGLHTRVFINSQGLPTYEAKELGLALTKFDDFPYDLSLIVTGNEIREYFKVLLKAMEMVAPELAAKTRHIPHGMVRLPSGKMSSRTGEIITGEWLLDKAADGARRIVDESGKVRVEEKDKEGLAKNVGLAAIKYAFLKSGIGENIEFDFDKSLSFEGNSGPYLQYTYARTQSVLAKAVGITRGSYGLFTGNLHPEEEVIIRWVYRFGEVIEESASRYAPNLLCNFLFELAQRYNTFYNKHSILNPDITPPDPPLSVRGGRGSYEEIRRFRLLLTAATGQVLKNGLELLGIEAPERM